MATSMVCFSDLDLLTLNLKEILKNFFLGTSDDHSPGTDPPGTKRCRVCNKLFIEPEDAVPPQRMYCSSDCYTRITQVFQRRDRLCLMPDCTSECARKSTGESYDYCGWSHADTHTRFLRNQFYNYGRVSEISKRANSIESDSTTIYFYDKDKPFYEFTNFARYPILIDGCYYHTSEHYFQSQKLVGTPYERRVAVLPKAKDAFEFPRRPEVTKWVRRDWESVKEKVMFKALYHKFTEYSELKKLLLRTRDRRLVEDSPHDSYWGIGRDGKGRNRLGELLMELRGILRGDSPRSATTIKGMEHSSTNNDTTAYNSTPNAVVISHNGVIMKEVLRSS